ncbi:MAG TPA: cytochrome c oxidase subunit II [Methyloradius sp.]|nr:cytochrome c oxidase subunit II [Methyloradius sp.]
MKKTILQFAILSLLASQAQAAFNFNLQSPVTPIAHQIYDLHTLILLVCLLIFIIVFGFMFYALFKHRKSIGHKPAHFHQHLRLEIIWTLVPFLILIGIAIPTTQTVLAMKNVEHSDMNIKITGHQWMWEYEYLGQGVRYVSNLGTPRDQIDNKVAKDSHYLLEVDRPLVVPTGKKVRVLLTSADVIHSWWLPQFGVKQDAIPGFIHEAWFQVEKPGTYRGQCAELCGVGHGFMPIVVEALPQEEYDSWLKTQKASLAESANASSKTYTLDELKTHGEKVYSSRCAACHQANGQGIAGMFPPLIDGAPFSAGPEVTKPLAERGFWKDGKVVLGSRERHLDILMNGISGTAMQPIGAQLSDLEVAAVVSYERNNWGNKTGDAIQPAEVAALRKGVAK